MKVSVTEGRDRFGAYIQGVGLRCFHDPNHTTYKRPITKENCDNIFEECDGFEEKCDGFVTDETLTSVGCDGCDGFLEVCESSGKNDDFSVMEQDGFSVTEQIALDSPVGEIDEIDENSRLLLECGENPSHPSHPSLPRLPAVTNPSQVEANPSQVEQVEQTVTDSTEVSENVAQCELPLYQRADGQIEVELLAVDSADCVEQDDLSEWMAPENLQAIASNLAECDSPETLALLRGCWHPQAVDAACKLLSSEKDAQIKEWEIKLDS
jgi:hypothetical protein